jgi:hypothetical protein
MMSITAAVESIVFHISTNASTGLLPESNRKIDEIRIADQQRPTGRERRPPDALEHQPSTPVAVAPVM